MLSEADSDLKARLYLFEDFVQDRLLCHLIYHPDSLGFVYVRFVDDQVIIEELYVPVRFRGQKVAGQLMKQVEELALKRKCKSISCSVVFNTDTAEQALAAAIHVGFKVGSLLSDRIILVKEL